MIIRHQQQLALLVEAFLGNGDASASVKDGDIEVVLPLHVFRVKYKDGIKKALVDQLYREAAWIEEVALSINHNMPDIEILPRIKATKRKASAKRKRATA